MQTYDVSPSARPWPVPVDWTPEYRLSVLAEITRNGAQSVIVQRWVRALAVSANVEQNIVRLLIAVQDLPYVPDDGDTYQGVEYTLAYGGDCEDLDTLLGAAMLILNVPANLVYLEQPGAPQDHMTVTVEVRGQFCYAETTIPGARLCEDPYAAVARLGHGHRLRGSVNARGTGILSPTSPWKLLASPQNTWTQWVQLDNAQGWLNTAVQRFARGDEIARMVNYNDQVTAVRNAFTALSNFYRALDLPATIDPLYLSWLDQWWGAIKHYDPPTCLTTRVNPEVTTGQAVGSPDPAVIKDRIVQTLAKVGKNKTEWDKRLRNLFTRMSLDDLSELHINDTNPFAGLYTGCMQVSATVEGCPKYTWESLSWTDPPPGVERIPYETSWSACPAMKWVYEAGAALAQQLSERGVYNCINEARNYQIALNVKGVIMQSLIDGTDREIADLIHATQNVALASVIPPDRSGINAAAAAIALAAAAAAAVNPAVGAALSIFATLVKLLPPAQGWDIAQISLGRCVPRVGPNQYGTHQYAQPIYTMGWIDGSDTAPPSYAVPVAPTSIIAPAPPGTMTPASQVSRRPDIYQSPFVFEHPLPPAVAKIPRTPDIHAPAVTEKIQQNVVQHAPTQSSSVLVPVVATVGAVSLAGIIAAVVYAAE